MATNLFIDTNIFLSFYRISNEDLNQLSKLADNLDDSEIVLFLPEQVRDEFQRNREAVIGQTMRSLRDYKFPASFPLMCFDYQEYERFRKLIRDCRDAHSSLVKALEKDIQNESLQADIVVEKIFDVARRVETTPALLERARNRTELGRPPGKPGSLGDAMNWEALLSIVPNSESLYIISDDGDFASPLDNESINPYLAKEWKNSKWSEVYFYRTLSGAFEVLEFPIILSEVSRMSECITELENSSSFQSTLSAIERLNEFGSGLSTWHLNRLLCALGQNHQVWMTLADEDVLDFYVDLIDGRFDDIYRETLENLKPLLGILENYMELGSSDQKTESKLQKFLSMLRLDPFDARLSEYDIPF